MTTLRRARLFLALVPTYLRLRHDVRALERAADRGESVTARAALFERRVTRALDRLDREA